MPSFGHTSLKRLNTCHNDLKVVLVKAIRFYDFSVIGGHRGEVEQMEAYHDGKSTKKWPESKHNSFPSRAVDIAPYFSIAPHIRWKRWNEFIYLAGLVVGIGSEMGIKLRWGGNWDMDQELITDQNLIDLGHIELIGA